MLYTVGEYFAGWKFIKLLQTYAEFLGRAKNHNDDGGVDGQTAVQVTAAGRGPPLRPVALRLWQRGRTLFALPTQDFDCLV